MPVFVALPIPKRQLFEYLSNDADLLPGMRVMVPFGRREMLGVVIKTDAESQWPLDKLKPIIKCLDEQPILDEQTLTLCHWLSDYYQHPIGDVLASVMPTALRKGMPAIIPKERFWQAAKHPDEASILNLGRAKKQQQLLQTLMQSSISHRALKEQYSTACIHGLRDKELIEELWREPEGVDWQQQLQLPQHAVANVEQAITISAIKDGLARFQCHLIEGVTGSGKTEVYLQIIESLLQKSKQILVLVPEIGLTPQTVSRFRRRYGIDVGVLHSNLTEKQRLDVWQKAKSNQVGIVLGTRSAIFTQFHDLGMIIVDEEHDSSFKQQDGLRYHARDFAIMRAKHLNIPLVLGSATPSLESLNNALSGRYRHYSLPERAGQAIPPGQEIVDLRNQPLQFSLSAHSITQIEQELAAGNQVMLFVNRRGYAPAWLCQQCGHVEQCHQCDKPMTVHKQLNRLQCHHCSLARPINFQCTSCGKRDMLFQGMGTEQLEEGLAQLFTQYNSVRIDSDSTRQKDKLDALLGEINDQQYQILIGTQILSKGHHFPHVTLVVIVDTDGALFSADYRAGEHLAQLITQLAGRAGRAEKPGKLLLQSYNPGHPLLQDLMHNGYAHFARSCIQERKQGDLPPFTAQALLRAESSQGEKAYAFLGQLAQMLASAADIKVIGPLPALMEKKQGRFRLQLLVQSQHRKALHIAIRSIIHDAEAIGGKQKMRWSVDIDPQDFI